MANNPTTCDARKTNVESYNQETWASGYRKADDDLVHSEAWGVYAWKLNELCSRFINPINALDIGCGTGRFFSALTNVNTLYGVDKSKAMLKQAETPANYDVVKKNIHNVVLLNQDMQTIQIPKQVSLIYSIGMLHEYDETTTTTPQFFNQLKNLLSNNGVIFLSFHQTSQNIIQNILDQSQLNLHKVNWSEFNDATLLEILP